MSRIGKQPINIPDNVEVCIDGDTVTVKGPKGELCEKISEKIRVLVEDGQVVLSPQIQSDDTGALWGLSRTLVKNMIEGVTEGFFKQLELVGIGYRARLEGKSKLVLNIGNTVPVEVAAPEGIIFEVIDNTKVKVSGINKCLVGQIAALIRSKRPPEPYKGKGIRYIDEVVRRKAGKAAKVGSGLGSGTS